jgi:hypothetical protein
MLYNAVILGVSPYTDPPPRNYKLFGTGPYLTHLGCHGDMLTEGSHVLSELRNEYFQIVLVT